MKHLRLVGMAFFSMVLLVVLSACNQTSSTSEGGSGKNVAQGVTDTEIRIGHFGPQTGFAANYDAIRQGAQSYFNLVNEQGGVNGRKIKLIAYDNEYQPSKTVPVATKLVQEDKVFAIVGTPCTPCHQAAESLFSEIPMIGPSPASTSAFTEPLRKNWFGAQTNYGIEGRFFVDYAVNKLHAKKVGIIYENDDYGKEGLKGAKSQVKSIGGGVEVVAEVPYNVQDIDFSSHAQQLKKADPDVIIMTGVQKPAAAFRTQMSKIGAADIPLMVTYAIGQDPKVMYDLAGKAWEGVYSTLALPTTEETDNPKIKEFLDQFNKDFPKTKANGSAQAGWAAAQILVEGIKRSGDDLTWDNFIAQMETIKDWEGSLYYDVYYTPDTRYGQTTMYLTQAKDGKLATIGEPIKYDPASKTFK
ncbi:ABC transporter substrate-binding protein [Bacillus sp. V5-8f]|uniref:ABC transporter substrate-binding protein n=1 Tax=Bacillus sp. V5-8f TaxID=2053044 RepID=UPI000C76E85F|nr:ABC transporter substrate-binding protein [Bacillus sp. V5-8f]PLT33495.1 ABC transporter substrate-binding protein [Bacillus sp. V5-8f]